MTTNPLRPKSRTELIRLVAKGGGSSALAESTLLGKTRLFGGFSEIPPWHKPGWILRIESKAGKVWLMSVIADEARHQFLVRQIDEVPWQFWQGKPGQTTSDIFTGDQPDEYAHLHRKANGKLTDWLSVAEAVTYLEDLECVDRTRATLHNWMGTGVIGSDGSKLKLNHVVRAGRYFTTKAWITEFLAERDMV